MLPWLEADVATDGGRLRVYRTGQPGARPVLLAHGLTDNARYWSRTVEALAPAFDVALYDARGHGQSSPAPAPFGESMRAAALWQVVEALQLEHPVLIGHSMGAATVAAAAAERPGAARGVVVEDPPWSEAPLAEPELRAYMQGWKQDLLALRALPHDQAIAHRRAEHPDWAEQDYELSLNARLEVDPAVLDAYQRDSTPWRERVRAIDCPLLLLTGEVARGAYVTPEVAQAVVKLGRAAQWVHLAGASHSARYSRFPDYLEAVEQFLTSLP
jgi:pimeloyl-ACP methyl ester carboxylesterase